MDFTSMLKQLFAEIAQVEAQLLQHPTSHLQRKHSELLLRLDQAEWQQAQRRR